MMRRPSLISLRSQASALSAVLMSTSMSSTGPGAPPCSGPLSAPTAPVTALTMSERVDAITRAAKVEAFMPWSETVTQ